MVVCVCVFVFHPTHLSRGDFLLSLFYTHSPGVYARLEHLGWIPAEDEMEAMVKQNKYLSFVFCFFTVVSVMLRNR